MQQKRAAYSIESLRKLFAKKDIEDIIKPLQKKLSCFNSEANFTEEERIDNPVFIALNNIITRGLPTYMSHYLEDLFSKIFKSTKEEINKNQINFEFKSDENRDMYFRAFHLMPTNEYFENIIPKKIDNYTDELIYKKIVNNIGDFVLPYIKKDVKYKDIFEQETETFDDFTHNYAIDLKDIENSSADIYISLPYKEMGFKGAVLETDNGVGDKPIDYITIEKKRKELGKIGIKYFFFKKGQDHNTLDEFLNFTYNSFFDLIKKNRNTPLYNRVEGLDAMQIVLSPFAIARIQKTIIDCVLDGTLRFDDELWKIAVIERDIPGAHAAIEDLQKWIKNFSLLYNFKSVPEIELDVFSHEKFQKAKLNKHFGGSKLISELNLREKFDLIIDSSVLSYSDNNTLNTKKNYIKLNSAFTISAKREFLSSKENVFINPENIKERENFAEAMNVFARNLLRVNELSKFQLNALKKIFLKQDVLISEADYKTKFYLITLNTFLKAGLGLFVSPHENLIFELFNFFRTKNIDSVFYITKQQKKIIEKKEAERKVLNGESLITLISYEKINNSSFRKTMDSIKESELKFSSVTFDQIQTISEYSDNYNVNTAFIPDIVSHYFKGENDISFLAFGARFKYESLTDIQKVFDMPKENILYQRDIKSNPVINILHTKKNKKGDLLKLVEEIDYKNKKTIIFSNSAENHLYNSLKEKIDNNFLFKNIEKKYSQTHDTSVYEDFRKASSGILFSDENEFHTHYPYDIESIIFTSIPSSVVSIYNLVSESDDNENVHIYILFSHKIINHQEISEAALDNGKIEVGEEFFKISYDEILRRNILRNKHIGRKRELNIIDELLNNIEFPSTTVEQIISKNIFKNFDININLSAQPKVNPTQIYVHNRNKKIGVIDYKNKIFDTSESCIEQEQAIQLLVAVKYNLLEYFGEETEFFGKIYDTFRFEKETGIENVSKMLTENETVKLPVSYTNSIVEQTLSMLIEFISQTFTEEDVVNAFENNFNHQDAIKDLNEVKDTNFVTVNIDVQEKIEELFYKYRNKKTTFEALKKLYKLGILTDVQKNDTTESFIVEICNKDFLEYKKSVMEDIETHVSKRFTERFKNSHKYYSGKNNLDKLVRFCVNYNYDYILSPRYLEIEQSAEFCKIIEKIQNFDLIKRSSFLEFFENFAIHKYNNGIISPDIELDEQNFDSVIRHIRIAGDSLANREHLLISSENVLNNDSSNFVAQMLYAYAKFWKESETEEDFNIAYDHLTEGFRIYEASESDLTFDEINDKRYTYLEHLYSHNTSLRERIEPIFFIKIHSNWLRLFNNKFLKEYEKITQ